MSDLPDYVRKKTAKGRTYYYFSMCSETDAGEDVLLRLPDISDPSFKTEVDILIARRPIKLRRGTRWKKRNRIAREAPVPQVYFIGGDEGPIKIGYAERPASRIRQLQIASPHRLRVLASVPGGYDLERSYHTRFAHARLRGEWFERVPDLLAEISALEQKEAKGSQ